MVAGDKIRGRLNTLKKLNSKEAKRKESFNDVKKKFWCLVLYQGFSKKGGLGPRE